jgi:nucleoside phosphorylase
MEQIMAEYVILSAVTNEAAYFLENFPVLSTGKLHRLPYSVVDMHGKAVAIVVGGIGTAFTASAATAALFEFQPRAIFFSGAAGGVAAERRIGDIVIAAHAFEPEIQGLASMLDEINFESNVAHPVSNEPQPLGFDADPDLLAKAKTYATHHPAIIGTVASTNCFPSPPGLFQELKQSNTEAIDMETSALYQVGWLHQAPTLAFRCVSNLLTSDGDYLEHEESYIEAEYAAAKYTAAFVAGLD